MGETLSSTTFAGRETELDLLCTVFASLETSGARTVLVGGEAGIGKTRLVEEFRSRARAAGACIAVGVCTPAEGGGLPYAPVIGIVRELGRVLDEPVATSALLAVRRELGLVDPSGEDAAPPAELTKTRRFEAVLLCLTTLAERARVVVVFEDLQWADSATMDLFDFLVRNLDTAPVLVVGTFRNDELDGGRPLRRVLTELGRHRAVAQLELTGLDRDAIAALMAGILGRQPEWALVDAVNGRCAGNPFFAEELTAARDATSLPSVLRNVILLRIDRLAPDARRVVSTAAAAGSKVDHRLLSAVTELDETALHAAIAEAVERGVLVVDEGRFAFRHALQRDAISDATLPTDRARLHHRLAVELTADPDLSAVGPAHTAVELAAHWWEAGVWKEARDASIAAGRAMTALLALPEAYAHYDRALVANDRVAGAERLGAPEHLELVEAAADTAYFGASTERTCELWRLALDLVDAEAEPERAAVCHARLARSTFLLGETERAFHRFRTAAEMIPADPPSVELARVLALQARCLLLMARFHDAADLCQQAMTIARGAGARAEEGHALDTYGMCLGLCGDLDGGIEAVRQALGIAEELGIPDNLNLGYTHLSLLLLISGRLEASAGVALDGVAMGEVLGGVRLNGAAVNSAQALIALGRTDDALALLDDLGDLVGNCNISPPLLRMMVAVRRGEHDVASQLAPQLDARTEGLVEITFRGVFQALAAELALNEGRPEDAQRSVEGALALAAGSEDPYQVELGALALRTIADGVDGARVRTKGPEVDKARLLATERLDAVEEFIERPDADVTVLPAVVAWLATARAEHSRLYEPDAELWADAATRWDALGQPYEGAYCRWREADALLQSRGGRTQAAQRLVEARGLASGMGAGALVARVERLAQRARLTLAEPDDGDAGASLWRRVGEDLDLTPREVEVLDQLARGRTDRQIADELYISRKTASVHVSNILRKLGVSGRVEAGEIGQRAGLGVDQPAPT